MIRLFAILLLTCAACNQIHAQVNIITTIAGTGTPGYSGDNGPATNAKLYRPSGICLDTFGNIFFADGFNCRIRKINPSTGIIATIAGTNSAGYNGDNIQATDAQLLVPESVFCDLAGNVYVADALNHRIRKINSTTGIITTVAGNGTAGYSGDGGPATNAELNAPAGVTVDVVGNIFIADYDNNRVRKIDVATGEISTIAGTGIAGYSGDGGAATNAKINGPGQAFSDGHGNVYFTEVDNHIVRKIDALTGIISTIAGNGTQGYLGDNGPAVHSLLNQPYGLFIDSKNNIFIDEWGNGVIRKIDALTGIIITVVGCGIQGFSGDGSPATIAKLKPDGVFLDKYGTIYVADVSNNRIRMVYNPKLSTPNETRPPLINIYPNPTKNELTIEYTLPTQEDATIQVTDLTGRLIITQTLTSQKQKEVINIINLAQGIYLYNVVQNGLSIASGRFIKD